MQKVLPDFCILLRQYRYQKGITRAYAASRAAFVPSAWTRYETTKIPKSREGVLNLAAAIGCTIHETDLLLFHAGFVPNKVREYWDIIERKLY